MIYDQDWAFSDGIPRAWAVDLGRRRVDCSTIEDVTRASPRFLIASSEPLRQLREIGHREIVSLDDEYSLLCRGLAGP